MLSRRVRRRLAGRPVGCFVEHVCVPKKAPVRRPATIESYRNTVRHWSHLSSDPKLKRVTEEVIEEFRNSLWHPDRYPPARGEWPDGYRPRPHAEHTVNKHLRVLRATFRLAERLRVTKAPDFTDLFLQAPKRQPRPIEPEILARIFHRATRFAWHAQVKGINAADWWRALVAGGVFTGFRKMALLSLRWDWIDTRNGLIHVPAGIDKCRQDRVKPANSAWLALIVKIRTSSDLVFPRSCCLTTLDREWDRIQRCEGIDPPRNLHDLKRTCGTMLAAIASAGVLKLMLDHSTLATSLGFYVDPMAEARAAVEAMTIPPPPAERTAAVSIVKVGA